MNNLLCIQQTTDQAYSELSFLTKPYLLYIKPLKYKWSYSSLHLIFIYRKIKNMHVVNVNIALFILFGLI